MHLARSALIVVLAAASLGGLADRSVAATGTYQVTLTQTAGTLKTGTVETVTAMVRVAGGATAADGTLVGFSTTGDVAVPDVVGMAPHGADGYWLVDSAGHVLSYGSAFFQGDLSHTDLTGSVVGIAATASGDGYWVATDAGKVYPFGDAGSTVVDTGIGAADPVVGIAGGAGGVWVTTVGGSVRALGTATFAPFGGGFSVAGIVATPSGQGYWLFSSGGAISAFGDAVFKGDMAATTLSKPVTGMMPYGSGYLLVGSDGGIFDFSERPFLGSLGANPPARPVVGIIPTPDSSGYWMFTDNGMIFSFGNAHNAGSRWSVPTHHGSASFVFTSLVAGQTTVTASAAVDASAVIGQTWTASDPAPPAPPPVSPPPSPDPAPSAPPPVSPAPRPDPAPEHPTVNRSGYWALAADGRVYNFGAAAQLGNAAAGAVDLEPTPTGDGYWILNKNGKVQTLGNAITLGNVDMGKLAPGEEPASLSATPTGRGYWIFTNRGRALALGDAPVLGDMSQTNLNGPVLGSVATPSGKGYYMVASDGGIFAFGDAAFAGSMGGKKLNAPVQSLVPDSDGGGYWLVATDGGIFAFEAPFHGSMGGTHMNKPVSGMVRYGDGYLMVGADGGIFNFSTAPFAGSLGDKPPAAPVVAVAALP